MLLLLLSVLSGLLNRKHSYGDIHTNLLITSVICTSASGILSTSLIKACALCCVILLVGRLVSVVTTSTSSTPTVNAVGGVFTLSIVLTIACTALSLLVLHFTQMLFMAVLLISVATFLLLVNVSCILGITYLIISFPLQVIFLLTGSSQLLAITLTVMAILPSIVAYNTLTVLLPLAGFVIVATYVVKPVLVM